MKILDHFQQGSMEWLSARLAIPTASEFDQLITPKFEPRKWTTQMPNSYLAQKLAEWWTEEPVRTFSFAEGDLGHILEDEAKPFYSFQFNKPVRSVGLCTNDEGTIGCSPDGLLGEDGGLEVKCPEAGKHASYLLGGEVPPDYIVQVHGCLYVTGRQWWHFMSYRRKMPHLVIQVNRDPEIIRVIDYVLEDFLDRFEQGKKKLITLNGGQPPPRKPKPDPNAEPVKFTWEMGADRGVIP